MTVEPPLQQERFSAQHQLEVIKIICLYLFPIIFIAISYRYVDRINGIVGNHYMIMAGIATVSLIERILTAKLHQLRIIGRAMHSIAFGVALSAGLILMYSIIAWTGLYPQGDLSALNRGIPSSIFVAFFICVGIPLQHYVVWGDFRERLRSVGLAPSNQMVYCSFLYCLMHIYYPDNTLILLSTLGIGFVWSWFHTKTDSMLGNMISHIVFGIGAFMLNLA